MCWSFTEIRLFCVPVILRNFFSRDHKSWTLLGTFLKTHELRLSDLNLVPTFSIVFWWWASCVRAKREHSLHSFLPFEEQLNTIKKISSRHEERSKDDWESCSPISTELSVIPSFCELTRVDSDVNYAPKNYSRCIKDTQWLHKYVGASISCVPAYQSTFPGHLWKFPEPTANSHKHITEIWSFHE